jgi:formylglycine-generating enzyme
MSSPSDPDTTTPSGMLILARFGLDEIADILALVTGVRPEMSALTDEELAEWLASTVARPGALDVTRSLPLEGKLAELVVRLDDLMVECQEGEAAHDFTTVIPEDPEEDTAPGLRDPEENTAPRLRDREEITQPEVDLAPERTDPNVGVLSISAAPQEPREVTDVGVQLHELSPLDDATDETPPEPIEIPTSSVTAAPAAGAPSPAAQRPSRMRLYLGVLAAELLFCVWICTGLVFCGREEPASLDEPPVVAQPAEGDLAATIQAGAPTAQVVALGAGSSAPAAALPQGGLTSMPRGQPTGRVHAALPESLDMRFIELTGGEFTMGASGEGDFDTAHERPAHRVRVESFWLGVSEVSVAQWYGLQDRGVPPSQDHRHARSGVSWCEAVRYANELSTREGLAPFYADTEGCVGRGGVGLSGLQGGYRLPTEAEWEYAARTGRLEVPSGSTPCLEALHSSVATGNSWGFAGMSGVLWEWTWDSKYRYGAEPRGDAVGPSGGAKKVIRGGSFASPDHQCTVTARSTAPLGERTEDLGFRLAR